MFNKDFLIRILKERGQVDFRGLAKAMKVKMSDNREFSKFLFSLIKKGELLETFDRKFYIPDFIGEIEGEIRISPKGFGFVDFEEDKSIFILANNTSTAMNSDIVKVKYFKDKFKDDAYQGIVTDVVTRNKTTLVGRVEKFRDTFGLIPFDKRITNRFRFKDIEGLEAGMEVKAQIIEFGNKFHTIKVIKKLGMFNDVSMDIITAIEDANVISEFFPETLTAAAKVPNSIDNEDKTGRTDLRDRLIVTIDGDDTKDFDDAIEVRKLDNGNYMLSVHIADVTHYVKEDQPIDREAKARGTSIYLADRVIPMLPESLSNGICSLNPHVDRFTLSCDMEINNKGETVSHKLYPSIINSKHRLTYKEVNNFYAGAKSFEDKELENMLNVSKELANIIRRFKIEEGYIDFEIEESKIIIDDLGKTVDIVPRERGESEILIEDFMVRANETVAKVATDMKAPFVYRIHDKPDFERITSLQNVLKVIGIKVDIPAEPKPHEFAKAVEAIKNSRFDDFMKIMMLRTMAKAEYSPENIGHFGLASKNYTHFTSPIRRYPDLMVHRMIREYIFNNKKELFSHFAEILPDISAHSSATEQRAVELERKVADIKKAEFYEKFVGQKMEGTIVSVLNFGMFVEFPNKVDGLVHISNLFSNGKKYEHVDNGFALSNGERKFTIGDKVEVVIVSANKSEAKIDLVIADMYEEFKNESQGLMKNNKKR